MCVLKLTTNYILYDKSRVLNVIDVMVVPNGYNLFTPIGYHLLNTLVNYIIILCFKTFA